MLHRLSYFSAAKKFGTCVGRQISGLSRSGCDSIGRLVESHISELIDYVNHGNTGSKGNISSVAFCANNMNFKKKVGEGREFEIYIY